MSDDVYIFYEIMKQEFKKAGRTDYDDCMDDLLKGDDKRFSREFGIKLPYLEEYKLIYNSDLPTHIKGKMQRACFAEWSKIMVEKLQWRLNE